MNLDMKSGAEAHALHTLRAILRGLEHREALGVPVCRAGHGTGRRRFTTA